MEIDFYEIGTNISKLRLDFWLNLVSIILMLIFALIIIIGYRQYKKFMVENLTFHTIENLYELFNKLSNNHDDWRLSHLFCVTMESYKDTCSAIANSFKAYEGNQLETKLIEYQLREHKMIVDILLFYEEVYFQYKHSKNLILRKEFLRIIEHYFKDKLLTNPRIVNAILKSNTGRELHLEEESVISLSDRFELTIKKAKLYRDKFGPFLIEHIQSGDTNSVLSEEVNEQDFKNWRKGTIIL